MTFLFNTTVGIVNGSGQFAVFQLDKYTYVCKCITWKEYQRGGKLEDFNLKRVKGKWVYGEHRCDVSLVGVVDEWYVKNEL